MGFKWLKCLLHDSALSQQVRKPRDDQGIQHVYLQEKFIPNVVSVEWSPFNQSNPCDIMVVSIICISPVAESKGMVNR